MVLTGGTWVFKYTVNSWIDMHLQMSCESNPGHWLSVSVSHCSIMPVNKELIDLFYKGCCCFIKLLVDLSDRMPCVWNVCSCTIKQMKVMRLTSTHSPWAQNNRILFQYRKKKEHLHLIESHHEIIQNTKSYNYNHMMLRCCHIWLLIIPSLSLSLCLTLTHTHTQSNSTGRGPDPTHTALRGDFKWILPYQ